MALGQLVVSLGLDAADFISGMTKSEVQARRFAQNLDRNIAAGIVKAELALTALGTVARATAQVFQSLTVGAGDFKDLEETTGASAESLAGLAVAAGTAGVEMDSVGGAANKLTKSLVGVDDESKAAGAALKALNLNIADFKSLDPVSQYEAVGKALDGYADGAEKVAVAQALFGKPGAEQLKVFKALEEAGGRQTILTQRQIELADAYADQQAKASAELRLYAQAAASEAIPAIADLTRVAVDLAKEFLGIDKTTGQLAANNGAKTFAEGVADAFAGAADQVLLVSRLFESTGRFIGAYAAASKALLSGNLAEAKAIGEAYRADLDELDGRLTITQRLAKQRAESASFVGNESSAESARLGRQGTQRPRLVFNGANTSGAAQLKQQLDGEIRAIRDFADQQRDAFDFANRYAQGTYEDGLISLQQYFDTERDIRAGALQARLDALNKEQAVLQAALPKAKAEERIGLENRIAEVVARRADAVQQAGRDGILAAQEEGRSLLQLRDRYADLRATILSLSGDTAGAARIRIDQQVAEAKKLLTAVGGNPADANLLRDRLTQTEALNEAQRQYSLLVERARNSEDMLMLAAREGGQSELETLRAIGAARQGSLADLSTLVDKANELALALGSPEAIQFAERLGLSFRQAAAEADPLLLKIRDLGEDAGRSIADNFADAIVEGNGLRDVLVGIEKDLVRIVTQNLVTKPLGDFLSNLIGGTGSASGGGGLIGSIGSWFGGLFGGGKAIGGPTMPNTIYPVGERRPEVFDDGSRQYLLTGSRRGRVDPNPQFGGGRSMTVNNTFVLPGQTDRRTQTQLAATAGRSVATANARNN